MKFADDIYKLVIESDRETKAEQIALIPNQEITISSDNQSS